jgi:hypothetical protein
MDVMLRPVDSDYFSTPFGVRKFNFRKRVINSHAALYYRYRRIGAIAFVTYVLAGGVHQT